MMSAIAIPCRFCGADARAACAPMPFPWKLVDQELVISRYHQVRMRDERLLMSLPAGRLQPGSWRHEARATIQNAIAANADKHGDPVALFKHINKTCYPFSMRKHLPYKMWLLELRIQREGFARTRAGLYGSPIERKCLACGANPGRPCKGIGEKDEVAAALAVAADAEIEGRMADASVILLQAYHEVRLASVRRVQLGSGPLFDREDVEP